ncbi:MAG: ABC transporter ATP-binding protein [Candidatus Heimdallarchaeota archaeon]|nr:ABC transporter ATP-binding protein [Candidatus Heimdallarchaeota archaeon]
MVKVSIKELSMRYEKKYILEDLVLDIHNGELLVILGESGCGKSTLLKIIAGIIEPEKGTIFFNDADITHQTPQKRNIGYVPQAQVLFPHMSVEQNIKFGLEARKLPKDDVAAKLKWIADLIQIEDLLGRYPREISGGQKQRVALARSMAIEPDVLLLDEPLSSIDASGRESLALSIRRIQKQTETTAIYVTHSSEEARLISDRVAIMYDGKIQQIGKIIDIDLHPMNYLVAKIMGTSNVWPVLYVNENNQGTNISVPIGDVQLQRKLNKKITGIRINPSSFVITDSSVKPDKKIVFQGIVKSIMESDEKTLRVIVDVKDTDSEYIKVDCMKDDLKKELKANTELTLVVDSKEVVLF